MSWGATIGAGILTGLAGAIGAGFLTYYIVAWYSLRRGDGADLGYYIVFIPFGLLCGFAIGAMVSRWVPGFAMAQAISLGAVALICALIATVAGMYGEVPPQLDGDTLLLEVEMKYPPGWQPDSDAKRPEGRSCRLFPVGPGQRAGVDTYGNVLWPSRRQVDGQWVVPFAVRLSSSREVRLVSLTLGKSFVQFNLPMAPRPSAKDKNWSAWFTDGFTWETGKAPPVGYAYRCKVERVGDIRDAEAAASRAFWEERERAAAEMPVDAPLAQWIPLFEDPDGTPAAYRWGGADRIERRTIAPRAAELAPLLQSSDPTVMRQAVFALGSLQDTPKSLVEPLLVAGKMVVQLIHDAQNVDITGDDGDAPRKQAETRALQYFGMWRNARNNAGVESSRRFRAILETIEREAVTSQLKDDVEIIAREAKEDLEKL